MPKIIYGTFGNDIIGGTDNDDIINGLTGADTMIGGKGSDTYYVENPGDVVIENANEGNDTVISSISYTLGNNVENLTLVGTLAINGTGNILDNVLTGNDAGNVLNGMKGADIMIGGKGDDTYYVDNVGDQVVETLTAAQGGGNDTIVSTIELSLANMANVENLILMGGPNGTHLTGNTLDNILVGSSADNIIDGGVGADQMSGGFGSDTYYVDNVKDWVGEGANQGIDTVISTVGLTQAFANIENYIFNTNDAVNITTGAEDNNIQSGGGSDIINAGAGINYVYGNGGNDVLSGGGSFSLLDGGIGNDWLDASQANIGKLLGGAGNDVLIGGAGDDTLDGGAGNDQMHGGAGNDTYYVDSAGDMVFESLNYGDYDTVHSTVSIAKLWDNVEIGYLDGNANLNLTGNALNNALFGNDGANTIDGGAGHDWMYGGKGDDTYIVDDGQDHVVEKAGEGTDTVYSSTFWYRLDDNVENLTLVGNAVTQGVGNDLDNVIIGSDQINLLDGGAGNDTMIGGKGDDGYYVDSVGDEVIETLSSAQGGGYDTVHSTISYTLTANVEELRLDGNGNLSGTGNDLDNTIMGTIGNNILDGGAGADQMAGGQGDDTYYVDNIGDVVSEGKGWGTDTVISSIALSHAFNDVENYTFNTNADVNFTGNDLKNSINGGSGNDTLDGGGGWNWLFGNAGDDTLKGGNDIDWLDGGIGADTLIGGAGNDHYVVDNVGDVIIEKAGEGDADYVISTVSIAKLWDNVEGAHLQGQANLDLTGNDLVNDLWGNDGNNILNGGKGADFLIGGKGDDTYIVDNVGDLALEKPGEGTDTVMSSVNYTLAPDVENLVLTGPNNLWGTGNDLDNTITGNDGANFIDGGLGKDTMIGGKGDDTYMVDNAGDQVIESLSAAQGGGHDHVVSSVGYSLANLFYVEDLTLTGAGNTNATGNALDNLLEGNSGNNVLDGAAGADHMYGYGGNDTYYIDNAGDVVWEDANQGIDTIVSTVAFTDAVANVENYTFNTAANLHFTGNALGNLIHGGSGSDVIDGGGGFNTLYGEAGNDTLIGGAKTDVLVGGADNDTLIGGRGGDFLAGGSGQDTFVFDLSGAGDGNDKVSDFLKAEDILQFSHVGDVNKDGKIGLSDLLGDIAGVVDHGAGQAVDVSFTNGSMISFAGCGTGSVHQITDLVTDAATQIHVS